jgi:hypothetical protein
MNISKHTFEGNEAIRLAAKVLVIKSLELELEKEVIR